MTVQIKVSAGGVVDYGEVYETRNNNSHQGSRIAHALLVDKNVTEHHPRFTFHVDEENVFFYVDGKEVVWWWTGDKSHNYQGAEIADSIKELLKTDVDTAFLAQGAQKSRWRNK